MTALFPLSLPMLLLLGACSSSDGDDGAEESTNPSSDEAGTDDEGAEAEATAGEEAEGTAGEEAEGTAGEEAEGTAGEEAEGTAGEEAEGTAGEEAEGTGSEDADTGVDDAGTDEGTDDGTSTGGEELEPSLEILDFSRPIDITRDGRVALLENPTNIVDAYLYDTVTGELTFAATIGDPSRDFSTGISEDLEITALHGVPAQAGLWSAANGWRDLPSPYAAGCDDVGGAWDLTADGNVVVGMMWDGCEPFAVRWVDDGGAGTMTVLDMLGEGDGGGTDRPVNRATVVSADGQVMAGFAENGAAVDRAAAIWFADGSGYLLDPDEIWPNEIYSISANGEVLAGGRGYDGFYWTEAEGMVGLGKLPDAASTLRTYPNAIALDGELIVGGFGNPWFDIQEAFVWTKADGMRSLQDLVVASGLEIPEGVLLQNVIAASDDGTVMLGYAVDAQWAPKTFVIRLDPAAYGL